LIVNRSYKCQGAYNWTFRGLWFSSETPFFHMTRYKNQIISCFWTSKIGKKKFQFSPNISLKTTW
jgi:hypothetical protein